MMPADGRSDSNAPGGAHDKAASMVALSRAGAGCVEADPGRGIADVAARARADGDWAPGLGGQGRPMRVMAPWRAARDGHGQEGDWERLREETSALSNGPRRPESSGCLLSCIPTSPWKEDARFMRHGAALPVTTMWRVLQVSTSGGSGWTKCRAPRRVNWRKGCAGRGGADRSATHDSPSVRRRADA